MPQDNQELLTRLQRNGLKFVGDFRFLNLDAVIDAKRAAGRDRDLLALKYLYPIKEKLEQTSNTPKSAG